MSKLYNHENHPHQPKAVTVEDARELHKSRGGLNAKIAVLLTKGVGTMWCAYIFALLSLVGLLGLLGLLNPFTFLLCTWVSQMFLQLVFLPILSVGQTVLGQHQELVTEETAKNTRLLLHQILQLVKHLNAQDEELLKQTNELNSNTMLLKGVTVDLAHLTNETEALGVRLESVHKTIQQLQKKASA